MKTMKIIKLIIIPALILLVGVIHFSCDLMSSPISGGSNTGTLVVKIPGAAKGNSSALKAPIQDQGGFLGRLVYRIECSGPGKVTKDFSAGDDARLTLATGNWNIKVIVLNNADLSDPLGSKTEQIAIEAGKTSTMDVDVVIETDRCEIKSFVLTFDSVKSARYEIDQDTRVITALFPYGITLPNGNNTVSYTLTHTGASVNPLPGTPATINTRITVHALNGTDTKTYTVKVENLDPPNVGNNVFTFYSSWGDFPWASYGFGGTPAQPSGCEVKGDSNLAKYFSRNFEAIADVPPGLRFEGGAMILLEGNNVSAIARAFGTTLTNNLHDFYQITDPNILPDHYIYTKNISSNTDCEVYMVEFDNYLLIMIFKYSYVTDGGGGFKLYDWFSFPWSYYGFDGAPTQPSGSTVVDDQNKADQLSLAYSDGDLSMFDGSMILLRKNGISNMANAFLITIRNYGFTEKDPGTPPGLYYYHKDTSSIAYYDLMIVETSDYLLIIFVRFSGNDDGGGDEKIINVANGAQWYAALDEIGNDSSGQTDYVINITNHIMVDPYYGFGFGFRTNIKVTINGDYNTISLLNGATGNLLYIRNGQNITLNNVNLKGLENNSEELVYVGGGYLKMMGNSSISNNNSGAFGYGGGVYVSNSGYFELTGNASIHDNKAKNGGGVYVLSGTFNMLGGSIHDNTASDTGGGVYISKNNSGSFEKTGGVIEDNTADTGIDRTKGNNVMVFISYMDPPYFKARHENASSETDLNSETDDGWDYIDL